MSAAPRHANADAPPEPARPVDLERVRERAVAARRESVLLDGLASAAELIEEYRERLAHVALSALHPVLVGVPAAERSAAAVEAAQMILVVLRQDRAAMRLLDGAVERYVVAEARLEAALEAFPALRKAGAEGGRRAIAEALAEVERALEGEAR